MKKPYFGALMGCLVLSYYEQAFPIKSGCSVFLSTAKAAQRTPKGNENSCAGSYKFGFNGQEKVNEIAGVGNHLDFKFRGYDSRIGRFWSVDPLTAKFPWLTPYQYATNNPIQNIDIDGLEGGDANLFNRPGVRPKFTLQQSEDMRPGSSQPTLTGSYTEFSQAHGDKFENPLAAYKAWSNFPGQHPGEKATDRGIRLGSAYAYEARREFASGGTLMFNGWARIGKAAAAADAIVARGISGQGFTANRIMKILTPAENDAITIFRGMKGTEGKGGALFFTEDATYAASYSSNVQSFTVSRSGFNALKNEGLIETATGINAGNGAKGTEILIRNPEVQKTVLGAKK